MSNSADDIGRITPHLRRFARALVRGHDAGAADDLVQETIVVMLRAERRSAALLLSCLSTLIRVHRLRDRQQAEERVAEAKTGELASTGRFSHAASRGASTQAVAELDAVPLECREVLLLVVLAGLTYAQVADVLGTTPDIVVARLTAARDRLASSAMGPAPAEGARSIEGGAARRPIPAHLRVVK